MPGYTQKSDGRRLRQISRGRQAQEAIKGLFSKLAWSNSPFYSLAGIKVHSSPFWVISDEGPDMCLYTYLRRNSWTPDKEGSAAGL